MMMQLKNLKRVRNTSLCFLMLLFSYNKAQNFVPGSNRLSTPTNSQLSAVQTGATIDLTANTGGSGLAYYITNAKIQLGIEHKYQYVVAPYQLAVALKIDSFNTTNQLLGTYIDTFKIFHNPFDTTGLINERNIRFLQTNSYRIAITVNSIKVNNVTVNDLPANAYIDLSMDVNKVFDFSSIITNTYPPTVSAYSTDCRKTGNEFLFIPLPNVPQAVDYQLEWTHVNDYRYDESVLPLALAYYPAGDPHLQYDFKHNSTRVTLNNAVAAGINSSLGYKIPLVFEHGYVVFRIRAIGRDVTNPSIPIPGAWSLPDAGIIPSSPTPDIYFVSEAHEANKNWQYSATYAEEGKKKEVISYFDGSLHNRQSVTKVNSNATTIVGETIYDHQGRPAINILPVPVKDPDPLGNCNNGVAGLNEESGLFYYENFNLNNSNQPYSRTDFDLSTNCDITAAPLNTANGAGNYYSNQNPNKNDQQAYVPDAGGYPFTQIEYTPDNTNRIRRQGGVGQTYQLTVNGTDDYNKHESRYFYGVPSQEELDRLFASEVGDASHYKKNMVVDANGQVSITYMDMTGKTIATALAGDLPKIPGTQNTSLEYLDSKNSATVQITEDMFKKNVTTGVSNVNTSDGISSITFLQTFLVDSKADHTFDYSFTIPKFDYPCLASNICFDCVYDLEYTLQDDCGQIIFSDNATTNPVTVPGKFYTDVSSGDIRFVPTCQPLSGSSTVFHDTQLNGGTTGTYQLAVGNYTLYKKLSVNKAAIQSYINAYINNAAVDANGNPITPVTTSECVKTLQDFIDSAVAKIDTSDCNISCDDCAKNLGSKVDFVASGKGTAQEYDLLLEECEKPCKTPSWCESFYESLKGDVSPGGQYGQYYNDASATTDPSIYPLSVMNTGNSLPVSSANFHHPQFTDDNGNVINYYVDDMGNKALVEVTVTGNGTFYPAVIVDDHNATTPVEVITDPSTGKFYTTPANLSNVSDFIAIWSTSFAKSLVIYHPEYCYYSSCKEYGVKSAQNHSSDDFDAKMNAAGTFREAVNLGLIRDNVQVSANPQGSIDFTNVSYPNNNSVAFNWFQKDFPAGSGTFVDWVKTPSGYNLLHHAYDPYISELSATDPIRIALTNKFNSYFSGTIGSTPYSYSMVEFAALSARCPNQFGTLPAAGGTCFQFGSDHYPNSGNDPLLAKKNDDIRDAEWATLKSLYKSEKLKLQMKTDNDAARNCSINNVAHNACDDCIGNSNFNPWDSGLLNFGFGIGFGSSFYMQTGTTCNIFNKDLYVNKVRRYPSASNVAPPSYNEMQYQTFLASGQCPNASNLQSLIDEMAFKDNSVFVTPFSNSSSYITLTNTVVPNQNLLSNFGSYISLKLAQANSPSVAGQMNPLNPSVNNNTYSVSYPATDELQVMEYDPAASTSSVLFMLDKTIDPSINWNDIVGISQLTEYADPLGVFNFKVLAKIVHVTLTGGIPTYTYTYQTLSGHTDMDLHNCSFDKKCDANQLAKGLQDFLSVLASNNLLQTTASTNVAPLYTPVSGVNFIAPSFANLFGLYPVDFAGSYALNYTFSSPANQINISVSGLTTITKTVKINLSSTAVTLSQINYFINIRSNYQNFFIADAYNAAGTFLGTVNGDISVVDGSNVTSVSTGDCDFPTPADCGTAENILTTDLKKFLEEIIVKQEYNTSGNGTSTTLNLLGYANATTDIIQASGTTDLFNEVTYTVNDPLLNLPIKESLTVDFEECGYDQQKNFLCIGKCQIQLNYETPTTPSLNPFSFPTISRVVSLTPSGAPDNHGLYHDFDLVVEYNSYPFPLQVTLKGTSCMGLKNCPDCPDQAKSISGDIGGVRIGNCKNEYDDYTHLVYSLNAQYPDNQIPLEYPTYADYVAAGKCGCFYVYLESLPNPVDPTDTNFVSFGQFRGCPASSESSTACDEKYNEYLSVVSQFIDSQDNPPLVEGQSTISVSYSSFVCVLDKATFVDNGICVCVDEYLAYLKALMNGSQTLPPITDFTYGAIRNKLCLSVFCSSEPPCGPPVTADTIPTIDEPIISSCLKDHLDAAVATAQQQYNNYIRDLRNDLELKYTQHCLSGVVENLSHTFTTTQHHYTLYYYDQAGNLVRTIPPAGVLPVDLTAYFQTGITNGYQIKADRDNKTQFVFTHHGLATTYTYNSLNQLVQQDVPDHDKINDWKYRAPNGLDTRLIVKGSHFVDAVKGYLVGNIPDFPSTGKTRGIAYVTNDGGESWQEMTGTTAANYKEIIFTSATNAYAVSTDGIIMASVDGGASWDMMQSSSGVGVFSANNPISDDLNDICYNTTQQRLLAVGKNGRYILMNETSNAIEKTGVIAANIELVSASANGTNYYVIGRENVNDPAHNFTSQVAHFYAANIPATGSAPVVWTEVTNINALPATFISIADGDNAFASSFDGILLRKMTGSNSWYIINTNVSGHFKAIHFADEYTGVALIDENKNGAAKLFVTQDGGTTWNLLFHTNNTYTALNFTDAGTPASGKLYGLAVGNNGKSVALIMQKAISYPTTPGTVAYFELKPTNHSTDVLKSASLEVNLQANPNYTGAPGNEPQYFYNFDTYVGGSDAANTPLLYYSSFTINNSPLNNFWTPVTLPVTTNTCTPAPASSASINALQVYADPAHAGNKLGAYVDDHNILYSFYALNSNTNITETKQLVCGAQDFLPQIKMHGANLYVFNNSGTKTLERINFNFNPANPPITPTASYFSSVSIVPTGTTITEMVNTFDLYNNYFVASVSSGKLYTSAYSTNVAPVQSTVKPYNLNKLRPLGSVMFAVGNHGQVFKYENISGTDVINERETNTNADLNSVDFFSNNAMLVVGKGGFAASLIDNNNNTSLSNISIAAGTQLSSTVINTNTTLTYNDVAVNGSQTKATAVGEQGIAVEFNIVSPALAQFYQKNVKAISGNIYAAAYAPSTSDLYQAGDNTHISVYSRPTGALVNNNFIISTQYLAALTDIHFANDHDGALIGANFLVRKTNGTETNWLCVKAVPGVNSLFATVYNKVWVIDNNNFFIVGAKKSTFAYFADVQGTNMTDLIPPFNNDVDFQIYTIHFSANHPLEGWLAGNKFKCNKVFINKPVGSLYYNVTFGTGGALIPSGATGAAYSIYAYSKDEMLIGGSKSQLYLYKYDPIAQNSSFVPVVITPTTGVNAITNDINFYDLDMYDYLRGYAVGNRSSAVPAPRYTAVVRINLVRDCANNILPGPGGQGADFVTPPTANNNFTTNWLGTTVHAKWPNKLFVGASRFTSTSTPAIEASAIIEDKGGRFSTRFWYDKLGRMVLSQNTKQFNYANKAYSYTLYDYLGRITEVGEKYDNASYSANMASGGSLLKFDDIFSANGFQQNNGTLLLSALQINDDKMRDWVNGDGLRKEVTLTFYDEANNSVVMPVAGFTQENLRKRIAHTLSYDEINNYNTGSGIALAQTMPANYTHATHYSYDIHGNVKTMVLDNQKMQNANLKDGEAGLSAADPNRYKRLDYTYDLISGKVNDVHYQNGNADAMHHHYEYDADNRITEVYTSKYAYAQWMGNTASPEWTRDAKYIYYLHGPLARVELGEDNVQGLDYYYTLQGWIKGVNSNTLASDKDPGKDGLATGVNINFAKDVFSYSLGYFDGEYKAIDASAKPVLDLINSNLKKDRNDLFNGNITSMVTTLMETSNPPIAPIVAQAPSTALVPEIQGMAYKYDQLNRIKQAHAYINADISTNTWLSNQPAYNGRYENTFTYDANGNILTQVRKDKAGTTFENLNYRYATTATGCGTMLMQNRLYHVNDVVPTTAQTDDIEDQGTFNFNGGNVGTSPMIYSTVSQANNYRYDEIGNMIQDKKEEIVSILWTVYGKIKSIIRSVGSTKKNLKFDYDATGNRIAKHIYSSTNVWQKSTYYVRDALGNVMSTYERKNITNGNLTLASYKIIERNILGSSRLGMDIEKKEMLGAVVTNTSYNHTIGYKEYELNNHLGNVLTVITDRKFAVVSTTNAPQIDYYLPEIVAVNDYSPFGAPLTGRDYRPQACVTTTTTVTVKPINDNFNTPGTAGWIGLAGSSLTQVSPGVLRVNKTGGPPSAIGTYKDFNATAGTVYHVTFDFNTGTAGPVNCSITNLSNNITTNFFIGGTVNGYSLNFTATSNSMYRIKFASTNFINGIAFFQLDNIVLSYNGTTSNTICSNVRDYRYGFNGMEKDDEIYCAGDEYSTEFRNYDSRLGRWTALDPLAGSFAYQSPYCGLDNNPISLIDRIGAGTEDGQRVNFIVVANKESRKQGDRASRKASRIGYRNAKRAHRKYGYEIIVAGSLKEAADKIDKTMKKITEKTNASPKIGTLIFEGHGLYSQPGFKSGNSRIIQSKTTSHLTEAFNVGKVYKENLSKDGKPEKQLERMAKYADANSNIVFTACYIGNQNPAYNGGLFLEKIHDIFNSATVFGSQSWYFPRSDRFEGGNTSGDYSQQHAEYEGEEYQKFRAAVGNWTMVKNCDIQTIQNFTIKGNGEVHYTFPTK